MSANAIAGLCLWLIFLQQAHSGLSLNDLILHNPTKFTIFNCYPYAVSSMKTSGRSWYLKVSEAAPFYSVNEANKALEYLATAITLRLELNECEHNGLTKEIILSLTNSTSAIDWMFQIRCLPKDSLYFSIVNFIARSITKWFMELNNFYCSEHIPGQLNYIMGLLSFDGTV